VPEVFQFAGLIAFCSQHSISEKVNTLLAYLISHWPMINFITVLLFCIIDVFYSINIRVFMGAKGLVNINVKKCLQKST
jgi:hypothetical protein